jgi:Caspase domain/Sel1 repeat
MLSAIIRSMLILLFLVGFAEAEPGERRVALVIGNADYVAAPRLDNPSNDATAVAGRLRDLGFSVTLRLNLDKASFEQAVRDFAGSLDGAEAAVFFYAGHGLQVDGRNYLVPIDADPANEADLPFQLLALDIALQRLASQRITNIVILDACRNNPLGEKLAKGLGERANAVGQGLASISTGAGTLISFSTQPDSAALDGQGADSPFTAALLQHIATPNVTVVSMMQNVRRDVLTQTDNKQVPWDNSSLLDDFFFKKEPQAAQPAKDADVKEKTPGPVADGRDKTDGKSDTGEGTKDKGVKVEPRPKPEGDKVVDNPSAQHDAEPDLSHVLPPHHDEPDLSHVLPPDDVQPVLTGRPPVTPCDTIAASATDPERVTAGVVMGDLDGAAGVRACRTALARYPHAARFEFQLARSLHKSEAFGEAAALYGSLVERGYFAALVNYGWLLNNGQGVKPDEKAAVRLYMLAAQQGDTLGMFNVAMAYDTGQGLQLNPTQAADWIYAALRLGHEYSIKQMSGPAAGWTRDFRIELQRLLKQAGAYNGPLNGVFGPEVWNAVRMVQTLPFAPTPGGKVPPKRWDPTSIPVNSPMPR